MIDRQASTGPTSSDEKAKLHPQHQALIQASAISPEARAGLRVGDILTGFDDEVFYRDGLGISLISEVFLRKPSVPGSYTLSLIRNGQRARLVVPLR